MSGVEIGIQRAASEHGDSIASKIEIVTESFPFERASPVLGDTIERQKELRSQPQLLLNEHINQ